MLYVALEKGLFYVYIMCVCIQIYTYIYTHIFKPGYIYMVFLTFKKINTKKIVNTLRTFAFKNFKACY